MVACDAAGDDALGGAIGECVEQLRVAKRFLRQSASFGRGQLAADIREDWIHVKFTREVHGDFDFVATWMEQNNFPRSRLRAWW